MRDASKVGVQQSKEMMYKPAASRVAPRKSPTLASVLSSGVAWQIPIAVDGTDMLSLSYIFLTGFPLAIDKVPCKHYLWNLDITHLGDISVGWRCNQFLFRDNDYW